MSPPDWRPGPHPTIEAGGDAARNHTSNDWKERHHMARLVGVDLPRDKRIEVALTYIYGIGRTRAQ